jgi:hypothetical protein
MRYSIKDVRFIPTWVYRGTNPKRKMHIVFPAEMHSDTLLPDFFDKESKEKMAQAFEDTKAIMTKYTSNVRLESVRK